MIKIGFLRNKRSKQHKREIKNVLKKSKEFKKTKLPSFSFGTKELGLNTDNNNEKEILEAFIQNWFKTPEKHLNVNNFLKNKESPIVQKEKERNEICYNFPSFTDKSDIAKFYESKQPFYGRGEKIAFIIIPHWNPYFNKYKLGTAIIRYFFLPVASYRYFPKYETEKYYFKKARYDVIGPNIGLTIKRLWQDVLNIQFFAEYLKSTLGYEKVGIWSYSIGSLRGYLASIFSENLFDYLIMNFLADNFSESLLRGISTQNIAEGLLKHQNEKQLKFLFSPLSPGSYLKHINKLPKHTRLVQSKYDLVFGEKNNKAMVEKIKKHAPQIDIEFGNFGHTTCGELEKIIPIIYRNSKFIWKNSKLKFLI